VHFDPPEENQRTKLTSMFFSGLRFLQFVFGLTVMRWTAAVTVARNAVASAYTHFECQMCFSAWSWCTSLLPFVMRKAKTSAGQLLLPQFVWEFVVTVLWLTLFLR
jgi:hypothetical protein